MTIVPTPMDAPVPAQEAVLSEAIATFSALVTAGKTVAEAVRYVAPLIKGEVVLLGQVLRSGTVGAEHQVEFRLVNVTGHGVYLREVRLDPPEGVAVQLLRLSREQTISFGEPEPAPAAPVTLPIYVAPSWSVELVCRFDAAATKARIHQWAFARMRFVVDALAARDPVEAVVGFHLRDEAP
jgi:hypothetical protein